MAIYNTIKVLKGVADSIAKFQNYMLLTHWTEIRLTLWQSIQETRTE